MVNHTIVQKITLHIYKLTLSTERSFLGVINIYFLRIIIFLREIINKLVLNVSHNQYTIVRKGPDNLGSGLERACTFQDKRIGQRMVSLKLFLHAAALLLKDHAKDRDTLIEQSFICIY